MTNHNPPTNGFDKRPAAIWRKGRAKSFDDWRVMLKEIMAEPAISKDGLVLIKIPKVVDGKPVLDERGLPEMVDHYATNAEMVARSWLKDPKRQQALIENSFGKVPQPVEVAGKDGKDLFAPETMTPTEIAERVVTLLAASKEKNDGA